MFQPITIKDICSRLQLTETKKTYGATFINHIKIYEYTPDIYMCTGNKNGYPLERQMMRCFCPQTHKEVLVSFQFLMDQPIESIHQLLEEIV